MTTLPGSRPSTDYYVAERVTEGPSYPHHPHFYIYSIRKNIISRCYNPKHPHYHCYGGRGIYLYQPWRRDCHEFIDWILSNIGERPDGYWLDRKDNDGSYVPGNLRWVTPKTSASNRLGAVV